MITDSDQFLIKSVRYCQAKNKIGKRCSNQISSTSEYCTNHVQLFKYLKPDTCPICYESLDNVFQPLSCGHWVDRECILKWKDRCPVCRAKIKLTRKERARLPKNEDEHTDLSDQAIIDFIRREIEEQGINDENIAIFEISGEVDLLSNLVIRQVVANLTQALSELIS